MLSILPEKAKARIAEKSGNAGLESLGVKWVTSCRRSP
jgi:hypothetical protein